RDFPLPMAETRSAAVDQAVPDDLISFLKAIPDGRYRRGVRYPQWFLLLVAVLGILSGCRSSRDLERFARRHREALNQALGLDFKRWPSDATFLYLFNKAHLQQFGQVLQAWMISQIPGGAEGLDQLVCDGKTLRGSALETADGSHRFVAQVTVYARALGVALAQKAYDTGESSERAALKELLSTLELEGVLIQADALHTTQAFFTGASPRGPTSS
ncbi:MAG: ISAs1 family transposase, partial [Synechococcaceae cyanobacterium]|nr:ISAs1 family transposase [Synechococcaceae cyanobacterium]